MEPAPPLLNPTLSTDAVPLRPADPSRDELLHNRFIEASRGDLLFGLCSPALAVVTFQYLGLPTSEWERYAVPIRASVYATPTGPSRLRTPERAIRMDIEPRCTQAFSPRWALTCGFAGSGFAVRCHHSTPSAYELRNAERTAPRLAKCKWSRSESAVRPGRSQGYAPSVTHDGPYVAPAS